MLLFIFLCIAIFAAGALPATPDSLVPEGAGSRPDDELAAEDEVSGSHHQGVVRLRLSERNFPMANEMRCQAFEWFTQEAVDLTAWQAMPLEPYSIHHMSLFACPHLGSGRKPGDNWDCMEHDAPCGSHKYKAELVGGFEHMMPNAPYHRRKITFPSTPDGTQVAYRMGKDTPRRYGVIALHNNHPIKKDTSGFDLWFSKVKSPIGLPKLQAFQVDWDLTDHGPASLGARREAVTLKREVEVRANPYHVWGFHLHYHSFGTLIQVNLVRKDGSSQLLAQRIGSRSSTVELNPAVLVQPGDKISAFCRYNTLKSKQPVQFGMDPFNKEMCDVFLWGYGDIQKQTVWKETQNDEPRSFPSGA